LDLDSLCRLEPLSCWAVNFPISPPQPPVPCDIPFLGLCLVVPPEDQVKIFGFAEFVQAFAILVLIFTVSDVRYRFRARTAPISLQLLTFGLSAFIGLAAIGTDLWFTNRYPLPSFLASHALWQFAFGIMFLAIVLAWLWYSFVRPPIFGKTNAFNFTRAVYGYLLQGNENDLPTIATELTRSARSIVRNARERSLHDEPAPRDSKTGRFANDLLLIIAIRKFCRHIVASSPSTAIAFFQAMSEQKKYRIGIGQFACNISTEAILNKDSILYHENEGFYSGYFGYIRPFTNALYGDYHLVEALTEGNSPLDIDLEVRWRFDAQQLGAYTRAVLTTFKSYLREGQFYQHSYALYRALKTIETSCSDLYKLNEKPRPTNAADIERRLDVVVQFINDAIKALDEHGVKTTVLSHRGSQRQWRQDFYQYIADLMFEVIFYASKVKTGEFVDWHIQHNSVWAKFFNLDDSRTRKIILFKLRRLLYENLRDLDQLPHFRNGPIAGLCLNVTGFTETGRKDYRRRQYPIHKMVLKWTKRRYHWLVRRNPKIASAFLVDNIAFDEGKMRLVRTYEAGLRMVAPTEELEVWEAIGPIKEA
jgi:hypothetical protein